MQPNELVKLDAFQSLTERVSRLENPGILLELRKIVMDDMRAIASELNENANAVTYEARAARKESLAATEYQERALNIMDKKISAALKQFSALNRLLKLEAFQERMQSLEATLPRALASVIPMKELLKALDRFCSIMKGPSVPSAEVGLLGKPISDAIELSVRASNCLCNHHMSFGGEPIITVGDLIERSEAELLRTPNFGRRSLNEVKYELAALGLHLKGGTNDV